MLDDKELNRAKDLLIKEGEARGGLRVEHLFRLVFSIAKEIQSPADTRISSVPLRTAPY